MITWVVGAGGLLGSAVARRCGERYDPGPVPWEDPGAARDTLRQQARGFEAAAAGRSWRIVWAAGAVTTAAGREQAMAELAPLEGLLAGIRGGRPSGPGALFLTSSAGALYAGASGAPFGSLTVPAPLSPYGELKLAQERMAAAMLEGAVPVVIGRIGNLYGPGQNLAKLQGLVSQLARASITRQPVSIFVPLDTMRDYVHVDDAARALLEATDAALLTSAPITTHVIATGRGTTVGQLIRTMSEIAKRKVPVALGTHASSAAQARDLRLEPSVRIAEPTPLPAGMREVHADLLARMQRAAAVS